MKLQAEYQYIVNQFKTIESHRVLKHAENVYINGEYNDFYNRIAWDIARATIPNERICQWYDKYNVNDKHITTVFKKAMFDCFPQIKEVANL